MPRNWRSRTLGIVGIGALVVGAGIVVAAPAGAAPVTDAAALRAAVTNLNTPGPATEIELSPGVTYTLPGPGGCKDDDENLVGDLDIVRTNALKIFTPDGQAPAILEMTCDNQRVIEVRGIDGGTPGPLTLRNVVIRNGHAQAKADGANFGGGVLSFGDVVVENSVFENNTAGDGVPGISGTAAAPGRSGGDGGAGGALAAQGSVTISGSRFTGNKAGAGGAGVSDPAVGGSNDDCDGGSGGQGGAVLAFTGLTVTTSMFAGNAAGAGGNGGEGRCGPGEENKPPTAGNGGGGGSGGALQCGVRRSEAEQSRGCDGQMVVRTSTFTGNTSGSAGNGGNGRIGGKGGSGGVGGAIVFISRKGPTTLLVENSTLDGNSSGNGGNGGNGISSAGNGGNGGAAGAIIAGPDGTGSDADEVATLVHATITENGGGAKGGAAGTVNPDGGDARVAAAEAATPGRDLGGSVAFFPQWKAISTVIGVSSPAPGIPDCWFKSTGSQFSLTTVADTDSSGCRFQSGSVKPFADFALGALADNGGPTQTRLPGPTSALVDKAVGVTGQLTVDQRGVVRPQAGGADVGAVELQLIDLAVTKSASETSVVAGTEVTFTITVKNTGTSSPQPGVVVEDPNCAGLSQAAGDTNTNNTLDAGELFAYTCMATPTEVGTFTNTATATVTDGAGVKITRTASVDVTVTAAAGGNSPGLANTGVNDPTPELIIGAWLIAGGLVLLLLARPRRMKIRANLD
jgi:uncharacterized repeat protein (TIGR01451 family)